MDDVDAALRAALRSVVGTACACLLATNSIRLRFDFRRHAKGRAYVWIDPPWRLLVAGAVVAGSSDYPAGGEGEAMNEAALAAWCGHFDALEGAVLVDATVGLDYPDLCLRFASGHQVETFSAGHHCGWYYKDRATGEVFEAGPWGIRQAFDEPECDRR